MKRRNNEYGYTLAELVAVLGLGLLIMSVMVVGVLNFIKSYQEISLYSRLQQEVVRAIETIRYGYAKSPITDGKILIGLTTAYRVNLSYGTNGNSSQMTITPVDLSTSTGETQNYSRFYLDRMGNLMVTSNYDGRVFTERVFPKDNKKIGRDYQFKIINKDLFYDVTPNLHNGLSNLFKIHIVARVRFRAKGPNQNTAEDLRQNTKTVDFETIVYASNVKKIQ